MKNEKLIYDCKRCGSELNDNNMEAIRNERSLYHLNWRVKCSNPNCDAVTGWYETPMWAIDVWNKEYGALQISEE